MQRRLRLYGEQSREFENVQEMATISRAGPISSREETSEGIHRKGDRAFTKVAVVPRKKHHK